MHLASAPLENLRDQAKVKSLRNMPTKISVLISDSTKMHCDLLRKAFYSVRHRFQVVAVLSSDLQDGPLSGIRILPEIRRSHPETKILLVMASPNKELIIDAFRLGAVGVFSRNSPFDLLCKSVEVVCRGQVWANAEELHYVLRAFAKSPKPPKLDPRVESRITRREAAVVRLAIEGLSNREIARQLTLSEHTVKNYLFRVFDKLGVSNRVELVLSCLHQEEQAREELAAKKELIARNVLPAGKRIGT